jgi:hypothetical protein
LIDACKGKLTNIFHFAKPTKPQADKAYVEEVAEEPNLEADLKAARIKEIMVALPYLSGVKFAEILQLDDLELEHEIDLVEIIKNYFAGREEITKNQDFSPEHTIKKELWDLLTEEEQKKRKSDYLKR